MASIPAPLVTIYGTKSLNRVKFKEQKEITYCYYLGNMIITMMKKNGNRSLSSFKKRKHITIFQLILILGTVIHTAIGRPVVRHIRSAHEFDRLLQKHAEQTGLPVIVDFYSDGCGPCRQIAPAYQRLAKSIGQENAVFVKIDVNALHELSSRYNVR